MKQIKFVVEPEYENIRIDKYLSVKLNDITRSGLEKYFINEQILVNQRSKAKNYKLKIDDVIMINLSATPVEQYVKPQNLTLNIIYEDDFLLVVNKAKGMVVHPASPDEEGTLVNALIFYLKDNISMIGDPLRPGIVHRIDKDTSGLLVIAKTDEAHNCLAKQAEDHTMLRRYEGIVCGSLKEDEGVIDAPIVRHPVYRTKNCVRENARRAVTYYRVLQRFCGFTHAEFVLETGRMHQIRVHMAHVGHPVAGDAVYGAANHIKDLKGQCLHAKTLGFTHPVTGNRLVFSSELPPYFINFLKKLSLEDQL